MGPGLTGPHGRPFSANVTHGVESYAELVRNYPKRWSHHGHDPADAHGAGPTPGVAGRARCRGGGVVTAGPGPVDAATGWEVDQLLSRYVHAIDNAAWDELGAVFTPDAEYLLVPTAGGLRIAHRRVRLRNRADSAPDGSPWPRATFAAWEADHAAAEGRHDG